MGKYTVLLVKGQKISKKPLLKSLSLKSAAMVAKQFNDTNDDSPLWAVIAAPIVRIPVDSKSIEEKISGRRRV